ncbi:MAG TPA: hypothetical protein VE262_17750 [Blastocatellia bacterium]|nr:hypothetical protein [Blastocatellia bacterium]
MHEFRSQYESCPEVCGRMESPGLALDMPIWVDHTKDETTVDQARIEAEMDRMDLTGGNILHVGVGNSKFAQRFAGRVNLIDGLTVSRNEKAVADALGIGNYTAYFLNKYSREFVLTIKNKYDFIVDNNMASFACCKYHFYLMMDNYLWSLKPGGSILTDQQGMDWVIEDPRWKLTYDDLLALANKFPVRASRLTDTVFSIQAVK